MFLQGRFKELESMCDFPRSHIQIPIVPFLHSPQAAPAPAPAPAPPPAAAPFLPAAAAPGYDGDGGDSTPSGLPALVVFERSVVEQRSVHFHLESGWLLRADPLVLARSTGGVVADMAAWKAGNKTAAVSMVDDWAVS